MSLSRLVGMLFIGSFLAVAAVSAQPPGVKTQPQIKPGMVPPAKPGAPDPKNKNPMPLPPGKGPAVGLPPIGPAAPATPDKKKDDIKWPKEVNGKSVDMTVKDMRSHSDPAVREACVRALPLFGPKGRETGANELVEAMTKDTDWNVRLAAMNVGPVVLLGMAEAEDPPLASGLNAIANMLSTGATHVRFEAVAAVAAVGPYMRKVQPRVMSSLSGLSRDTSSWQMRRAAVAALGRVAQGMPKDDEPDKKGYPEMGAVTTLLEVLKSDPCALVRREALSSLIGVGPVAPTQQKSWRTALDNVIKLGFEKDKNVLLWTRVCIVRNDPNGLKGNELHLDAIAKALEDPDGTLRLDACHALGLLGEEAVTKLQALIDVVNKEKEPLVVVAAILAITAMPSKDAVSVPILNNVKTTHMNADVRKVAEEAVNVLKGKNKK